MEEIEIGDLKRERERKCSSHKSQEERRWWWWWRSESVSLIGEWGNTVVEATDGG